MERDRVLSKSFRIFNRQITTRQLIFIIFVFLCFTPFISAPLALFLGIVIAQFIGHPFLHLNRKATTLLLQVSIVGLGFGMNVGTALKAGAQGFLFTVISISVTLLLGIGLGKLFGVDTKTSQLVACGTAICGGSAIAAVAPVIQAEEKQMSVALGIIFVLNSVALFIFPPIGHALHLSETQFGLWCAIAIHDTSSVVGAASRFGTHALEVATTVKLARALWIIPVALLFSVISKNRTGKLKIPYFIGWFMIAIIINSYLPGIGIIAPVIVAIAKTGLKLTLFLIGAGLSNKVLRSVGIKPLLQGVFLWIIISVAALVAITLVG